MVGIIFFAARCRRCKTVSDEYCIPPYQRQAYPFLIDGGCKSNVVKGNRKEPGATCAQYVASLEGFPEVVFTVVEPRVTLISVM